MPLVRVDVVRGRSPEELRTLLDTLHEAMVGAFETPDTDRYQVLTQHDPGELVALDTGLGIERTDDLVVVQLVSRERDDEKKTELYRRIAEGLEQRCGIAPSDVIVTITENGPGDWSFGLGRPQFLTGEL